MTPDAFLTAYDQAHPEGPRILRYTQAPSRNTVHQIPVARLTVVLASGRTVIGEPANVHRKLLG